MNLSEDLGHVEHMLDYVKAGYGVESARLEGNPLRVRDNAHRGAPVAPDLRDLQANGGVHTILYKPKECPVPTSHVE
jgi:hypothetical protein